MVRACMQIHCMMMYDDTEKYDLIIDFILSSLQQSSKCHLNASSSLRT